MSEAYWGADGAEIGLQMLSEQIAEQFGVTPLRAAVGNLVKLHIFRSIDRKFFGVDIFAPRL